MSTIFTNGINGGDLMAASPEVGKVLARDKKILIQHSGSEAFAKAGLINLPMYDPAATFSQSEVAMNRGYLDHEVSHQLRSDIPLWDKFADETKGLEDGPLLIGVANVLEDIRIDAAAIKDPVYGHGYLNGAAALEQHQKEVLLKELDGTEDWSNPRASLPLAIQALGYQRLGVSDVKFTDQDAEAPKKILDKIPDAIKAMANGIVDQVLKVEEDKGGTAKVIEMARTLVATVKKQEEEHGKGSGGSAGTGDGSGKQPGDPRQPGTGGGGWDGNPIDYDKNISELLEHKLGDWDKDSYAPFTYAADSVIALDYLTVDTRIARHLQDRMKDTNPALYANILSEVGGVVSTLKTKLERAIMARKQAEWVGGKPRGRLNSRALPRVATGNALVFKKRESAPALDTAISMLIDCSGSMGGAKMQLAAKAAIAMAEALDRTGVPFEVSGFNNVSMPDPWATMMHADMEAAAARHEEWRCSRLNAGHIYMFKDFEARLRNSRRSMAYAASAAGGDNADGDHLLTTWRRLRSRPEKRKIMLVLSDGQPSSDSTYGDAHLAQHLRDVIEYLIKCGVQLVGIGIKDESVKRYYPKYTVLNDINELPGTVITTVAGLLLGQKLRLDNSELLIKSGRKVA